MKSESSKTVPETVDLSSFTNLLQSDSESFSLLQNSSSFSSLLTALLRRIDLIEETQSFSAMSGKTSSLMDFLVSYCIFSDDSGLEELIDNSFINILLKKTKAVIQKLEPGILDDRRQLGAFIALQSIFFVLSRFAETPRYRSYLIKKEEPLFWNLQNYFKNMLPILEQISRKKYENIQNTGIVKELNVLFANQVLSTSRRACDLMCNLCHAPEGTLQKEFGFRLAELFHWPCLQLLNYSLVDFDNVSSLMFVDRALTVLTNLFKIAKARTLMTKSLLQSSANLKLTLESKAKRLAKSKKTSPKLREVLTSLGKDSATPSSCLGVLASWFIVSIWRFKQFNLIDSLMSLLNNFSVGLSSEDFEKFGKVENGKTNLLDFLMVNFYLENSRGLKVIPKVRVLNGIFRMRSALAVEERGHTEFAETCSQDFASALVDYQTGSISWQIQILLSALGLLKDFYSFDSIT